MPGIKGGRVDYGDKGSVGASKDSRTGEKGDSQGTSIAQPTRAQRPVSKTENHMTDSRSAAEYAARPTSGSKK